MKEMRLPAARSVDDVGTRDMHVEYNMYYKNDYQVQWQQAPHKAISAGPRLRRRSTAARMLRSWVRIPQGAWMFVCCECCVLSGRGLCDELITVHEESYRLWRVVVCDKETSCDEEAMKYGQCRWATPVAKTHLSNLGQSKISSWSRD
jgi:hypothetical protein